MDIRQSPFMYCLAFFVIIFVIVQSAFFIRKAWKRAKELGIESSTLKNTVTSSILFTIAPAIAILATVIALAKSLGLVLPWIRLSVIGNLAYESAAAETTLSQLGGSISQAVTDPTQFSAIAWVMTIGSCLPLILMPILCKKIQSKVGNAMNNSDSKIGKLADYISAAAFIGIIAAFVAQSINGKSSDGTNDAGFLSIAVLISSVLIYLLLELIIKKTGKDKFEPFIMPLSMFGAMGVAVLLTQILPANLVGFTWFN